ncbi:unnamed protein product [Arabidopsis halleri]
MLFVHHERFQIRQDRSSSKMAGDVTFSGGSKSLLSPFPKITTPSPDPSTRCLQISWLVVSEYPLSSPSFFAAIVRCFAAFYHSLLFSVSFTDEPFTFVSRRRHLLSASTGLGQTSKPYMACPLVLQQTSPPLSIFPGHYSSFVSTPLLWLSDYQSRVQAPSIVPTVNLPSVAPGSLLVVICYLALAVNSWDWLGLVQPCVSSSDMYVAFPCAPPAIGISWAGFVLNCVCTRNQTGSLFNGQSLPSWALLSIYMTSGGIVSVTLCCGVHRPSNSLLLVLNYLNMRILQFQVPRYEDVFKFDQNFGRMAVMSPKGWHIGKQSLEIIVFGFGTDLNSAGPTSSIGVLCGVDGLCVGLGFTEEDICVIKSQLIQPSSQKIEAFLSFSDSAWLQSTICFGLGWCFKDPLNGKIHGGSLSRPFVSSVLVAEALALKAALALGVSRLACISDCQELVLLPNTGGHAIELDGISSDFDLFRSMILSMSAHFIPRSENCGADALAKASLLSCILSSISGV